MFSLSPAVGTILRGSVAGPDPQPAEQLCEQRGKFSTDSRPFLSFQVLENYSDAPMTPKQILQVIEAEGLKEMRLVLITLAGAWRGAGGRLPRKPPGAWCGSAASPAHCSSPAAAPAGTADDSRDISEQVVAFFFPLTITGSCSLDLLIRERAFSRQLL